MLAAGGTELPCSCTPNLELATFILGKCFAKCCHFGSGYAVYPRMGFTLLLSGDFRTHLVLQQDLLILHSEGCSRRFVVYLCASVNLRVSHLN